MACLRAAVVWLSCCHLLLLLLLLLLAQPLESDTRIDRLAAAAGQRWEGVREGKLVCGCGRLVAGKVSGWQGTKHYSYGQAARPTAIQYTTDC